MKIHKDFKGDLEKLNKITKLKNIKSILEVVELVVKSYPYEYTRLSLVDFLNILREDINILFNYIKQNSNKFRQIHLTNILILNKFIFYAIHIKIIQTNKSKYSDSEYNNHYTHLKQKTKKYGYLFFKKTRKTIDREIEDIYEEETINKLLANCKLI